MRLLGLLLLLALGSCLAPTYQVYGTDLEDRAHPRAFLWPSDERGDSFRFVVERPGERIGRVRTLEVDPLTPADLGSADLAGAAIALPPDASTELRAASRGVLDDLARRHTGFSTHLVVTAVRWSDVRSREDLFERVRAARDEVAAEPPYRTFFGFFYVAEAAAADLVVIPRTDSDEFLLAIATRRPSLFTGPAIEFEYDIVSHAEVLDRLDSLAVADRERAYLWAVVLIPADALSSDRERCDRLLSAMFARRDDDWAILRRITRIAGREDFDTTETLPELLPKLASEPFEYALVETAEDWS